MNLAQACSARFSRSCTVSFLRLVYDSKAERHAKVSRPGSVCRHAFLQLAQAKSLREIRTDLPSPAANQSFRLAHRTAKARFPMPMHTVPGHFIRTSSPSA